MKHMLSDSIHLPAYTPLTKFWIRWLTATKSHSGKKVHMLSSSYKFSERREPGRKELFSQCPPEDTTPIILGAHQQTLGNWHRNGVEQEGREGQGEEISLL